MSRTAASPSQSVTLLQHLKIREWTFESPGGLIFKGQGATRGGRADKCPEEARTAEQRDSCPTPAHAGCRARDCGGGRAPRPAPRLPVWMSLWVSIVFLSLKVFPHSSHMKSLIPAGEGALTSGAPSAEGLRVCRSHREGNGQGTPESKRWLPHATGASGGLASASRGGTGEATGPGPSVHCARAEPVWSAPPGTCISAAAQSSSVSQSGGGGSSHSPVAWQARVEHPPVQTRRGPPACLINKGFPRNGNEE